MPHDARNDFNADGISDILWRGSDGLLFDWLGDDAGAFRSNSANFSTIVEPDWRIVGAGDFNGDGIDDVLWQRGFAGELFNWLGSGEGRFINNSATFGVVLPSAMHLISTGDFNGDGKDDLLFRNANGLLSNWLGNIQGSFSPNQDYAGLVVSTEWQVAATGDFNGDGIDDILWRQDVTGNLLNWLGTDKGGFVTNSHFQSSLPSNVHIVGTGDFNGDGRDDVLFRTEAGLVFDWLATGDGAFLSNTSNFATVVSNDWLMVSIGDFNGDGIDDMLWRQELTGRVIDWVGNASGGFFTNTAHFDSSIPSDFEALDPNVRLLPDDAGFGSWDY